MPRRRIVVASGRFDLIHKAHIRYLEKAKAAGGRGTKLIVVVARDKLIKRETGSNPVFDENSRLYMIRHLKPVDRAVLGPSTTDLKGGIMKILLKLKPDVIALGYDQKWIYSQAKEVMREMEWKRTKLVRIRRFNYGYLSHSSTIKNLIASNFKPRKRI
jgi:FAD synthetase